MYPVPGRAVFVGLLLVAGPNLSPRPSGTKPIRRPLAPRHQLVVVPVAPTLASGGTYVTNRASKTVTSTPPRR
jgi:hypothetical protein